VKICEKYIKSEICSRHANKHISLIIFLILFSNSTLFAAFNFSTTCQEAMQKILDLKFKDARLLIESERKAHPDNGYVIYLEHYSEAIELIITEEPALYEHLIDNYEIRLEEMEELDDGSPDFEWLQAEVLFHTGLAQVKFGTRISGAMKMYNSYRKIKDHRQKYPQFWQNQKLTGIYNLLFDNIPGYLRWATDMFGLAGNSDLGMYQLQQYCDASKHINGLAEEGILITSLGFKLIQQEKEGLRFLAAQDMKMLDITLVKYLHASIAMFTYQNDLALRLLSEIYQEDLQTTFYGLDYLIGRCKQNHLENEAEIFLKKYLDSYPGLDYKKDACNRLSYYYLLKGDDEKYQEYKAMVATVGQDLRDRDQEAILESQSAILPHIGLLKARLLCDGGYFAEADSIIRSIDLKRLSEESYKLEYNYRMGRILQLNGHPDEAVQYLVKSYNEGISLPFTFATRAALSLGKIYEEKQDYPNAVLWYERCVDVFSSTHTTEGVKDSAEKGEKRAKAKF
jgi:hypothetical protein